jgi:hypothetical protein
MRFYLSLLGALALFACGVLWQFAADFLWHELERLAAESASVWAADMLHWAKDHGPAIIIGAAVVLLLRHFLGERVVAYLSPLEIVHEPESDTGRYEIVRIGFAGEDLMSVEQILRVGIRNRSRRTIRNVGATLAGNWAPIFEPQTLRFLRTGKSAEDINPQATEIVELLRLPRYEPAANIESRGFDITVTASGNDTRTVSHRFRILPGGLPAIRPRTGRRNERD